MLYEVITRYQQSIISGFREVEDALVATTKGRESQEAKGRKVSALETYSRLAKNQYDAGTTSYLQVLDANRSLFSSQLEYVQNQTAVLVSLVDIYRAMGGGWLDIARITSYNVCYTKLLRAATAVMAAEKTAHDPVLIDGNETEPGVALQVSVR